MGFPDAAVAHLRAIVDAMGPLRRVYESLDAVGAQRAFQPMWFNQEADRLLADTPYDRAEWLDKAARFLIFETLTFPGEIQPIALLKTATLARIVSPAGRETAKRSGVQLRRIVSAFDMERARHSKRRCACYVVTALPTEFRAMLRRMTVITRASRSLALQIALTPPDELRPDSAKLTEHLWVEGLVERHGRFAKVVLLLLREYGPDSAHEGVLQLLDDFELDVPRHVFVVGVAGHLQVHGKLRLGDVVVSTGIYDSRLRKVQVSGIQFKKDKLKRQEFTLPFALATWRPMHVMVKRPEVKRPKGNPHPRVEAAPVVSGSEVVKSKRYKRTLQNTFPDAAAVEMEAAGCLTAFVDRGVPVTVVKGLADWSTHTKADKWQPYCSDIAADCAADLIVGAYGIAIQRGASRIDSRDVGTKLRTR